MEKILTKIKCHTYSENNCDGRIKYVNIQKEKFILLCPSDNFEDAMMLWFSHWPDQTKRDKYKIKQRQQQNQKHSSI